MSLFNSIKIRTPESVELEFSLAGVGSRAVALAIDYIVLGIGLLLVLWLGIFVLFQLGESSTLIAVDTDTLQLWAIAILSLLLFGLYVGYFVGFETLWYGQTPGKRYAKIRVIRDDAQPVRLFQATLRAIARPVDDILFIGFFFILLGKQEKRIGDWLAGTLVVQMDSRSASEGIKISDTAKAVSPDLLDTIDFNRISPDNFATIREYLQRRGMMTPEARQNISTQLAQSLKAKVELEQLPTEMSANTFLESIYWSYQQRKGRAT
ncbi:RDD family protein [cf. Phormidesmis sp. LEGE 11477]|uniref:RDD family protein n=1 Tax=cf. Phormidesmis sp. LEGE 11477 TaxID=1828680 RepID=UPI001882BD96|nr:RDD family protein [cf. Phormidesmis sp. LEGE 11477]MBE9059606.1 RDD family protein [cf. Phormidesmis sp. LEGE 11477]